MSSSSSTPAPKKTAGPSKAERQKAEKLVNQGDQIANLDPNGAIEMYQQAEALAPDDHQIAFKLAKVYVRKEEWKDAAAAMKRALALAPDNASYWYELGFAQEQQAIASKTSFNACRASYQTCVALDKMAHACRHRLGLVHRRLGNEDQAAWHFAAAVALQPNNTGYSVALAQMQLSLNRNVAAQKTIEHAQQRTVPNDPLAVSLLLLLAAVHHRAGATRERIDALERAHALGGHRDPILLFILGRAHSESTPPRRSEALQMLRGFVKRGCRGARAREYARACSEARQLIGKLRGP